MKLLLIYSLKRSGQHAIINWLCRQSGKNIFFGNIIQGYERICASNYITYENGVQMKEHYIQRKKVYFDEPIPNPYDYDLCVMNFEDMYVDQVPVPIDLNCPATSCIIIRDPYNLFSSRIQTYGNLEHKYTEFPTTTLWKAHAQICLSKSVHNHEVMPILFNRWASEMEYRKNLAHAFGLDFTDNGFDETPLFGGSAFEGERSVFTRWLVHREEIKRHIDPEIKTLSQQLFGEVT